MQESLPSSAENQTGYQPDEFGSRWGEDRWLARRLGVRFGWTWRSDRGVPLSPRRQATAHKNDAALQVLCWPIELDRLPPESFVGFHGALRNRRSYIGRRGFFLLPSARSRLRR